MSPILVENNKHSDTIVAFGGISHQLMMPVFEFFNFLKDTSVNKVFVRDFKQCWYYAGLNDVCIHYSQILPILEDILKQLNTRRTLFVGTSAGGTAALKFGHEIADKIVAFSPQIFLDDTLRKRYNDTRWKDQIANLHKMSFSDEELRLFTFIKSRPNMHIYYCKDSGEDKIHAEYMRGIANLMEIEGSVHNVTRVLKTQNKLQEVLNFDCTS
jgi:predicted esterase YcpF (UPF0227 family)